MSKLSKRVDELERVVRELVDDSLIELYAGDSVSEWKMGADYDMYEVKKIINRRKTTVKKALLELLRQLDLELIDLPPLEAEFTIAVIEEEDDD